MASSAWWHDLPGRNPYPCLSRCHAAGSAVVFRVFPSHGPILRCIPSLLTGSRGVVRLLSSRREHVPGGPVGTMNALRLPTARGSRFARRFTFATRLAACFALPHATAGARQPGLLQPGDPSGAVPGSSRISQVPRKPLCPSRVPRDRLTPTPCSSTPAEPRGLAIAPVRCRPRTLKRQGLRRCLSFSRLNHTARCSLCTLHASVAADDATLASGGWLALTGPAFAGWVSSEWFHLPSPINSSLPELRLARLRRDPYAFGKCGLSL